MVSPGARDAKRLRRLLPPLRLFRYMKRRAALARNAGNSCEYERYDFY
jgi:hypothetical protein